VAPFTTTPESRPAQGFTLVEVLVSVALFSALLAGAAGLLAAASDAIRMGRLSTTAALLAMQKVEQLRANPLVLGGGLTGTFEDRIGGDGVPGAGTATEFVRRWTLTPGAGTTSAMVEVFAPRAGRVAQIHALLGGGA
jgi:prepilin-type N-terminal cleavage/methylation domain-containing protein